MFVTGGANLFYSYQLFVDDKTSYIFETGLKQVESLNDEVNLKIKEFATFLSVQNTLTISKDEFEKLLSHNGEILATGEVDSFGNIVKFFKNATVIEKQKEEFNLGLDVGLGSLMPKQFKLNELELVQFNPTTSAYIFMTELSHKSYSFFLCTKTAIANIYNNENEIFNNLHLKLDAVDPIYGELGKKIKTFPSLKGAFEFETPKGQALLVSFIKLNESKFALASVIDKKKAFQVTNGLIVKTMLFGGFLLGTLIALGVIFSASITGPIELLTGFAHDVSKGLFNKKFKVTTNDEIAILGTAFNTMSTEIELLLRAKEQVIKKLEVANVKLEDYGRNLSKMVEQRTLELKKANDFMGAMVNSLDQGLMVFDQELMCHDVYTAACEKLFDLSPKNKHFYEVLGVKDESEIKSIEEWSSLIFMELISFESAAVLGPTSKITGNNFRDSDYKNILLNYYPMRDENHKIQNIVAVATDKTKEVQSIEIANEKEAYVNMVIKVLNNKSQFQSFTQEVEKIIKNLFNCYDLPSNTLNLESAMMQFHTLNGGFGIYNLNQLQQLARGNESLISKVRLNEIDLNTYQEKFHSLVVQMNEEWKKTIIELDQVLLTSFASGVATKEIDFRKIIEIKKIVDESTDKRLKTNFYSSFIFEPIKNYFQPYNDLLKNLSKNANKNFNGITIKNGELLIDPGPFKEFFNVLVHLFRNCIDHGIEDESTRLEQGKPVDGFIGVECEIVENEAKNHLKIVVQDDGAGINPEKIKYKLISLFPEKNFDSLTEEELIGKIFDPFFTTRNEVSSLSGRGVGMSAIKEVVDALSGTVHVESRVGSGSIFVFLLPISI